MGSHYHIDLGRELLASGSVDTRLSDFEVLRATGINIAGPVAMPRDATRLEELHWLFEGALRHSDDAFMVMPQLENTNLLGGHWDLLFSHSVYYVDRRAPGTRLVTEHPEYGRMYNIGSADDLMTMIEAEDMLVYMPHPRTKGSAGYPDAIANTPHFLSDRYRGGGWRWGMGSDLSEVRLSDFRAIPVLDDMNNWIADTSLRPKYLLAMTETLSKSPGDDIYANGPVSYLRIGALPQPGEYAPIVDALMEGDYFVTSGEVLIPSHRYEGGGANATLTAEVQWTFPLDFVELVYGDGETTTTQVVQAKDLVGPDDAQIVHVPGVDLVKLGKTVGSVVPRIGQPALRLGVGLHKAFVGDLGSGLLSRVQTQRNSRRGQTRRCPPCAPHALLADPGRDAPHPHDPLPRVVRYATRSSRSSSSEALSHRHERMPDTFLHLGYCPLVKRNEYARERHQLDGERVLVYPHAVVDVSTVRDDSHRQILKEAASRAQPCDGKSGGGRSQGLAQVIRPPAKPDDGQFRPDGRALPGHDVAGSAVAIGPEEVVSPFGVAGDPRRICSGLCAEPEHVAGDQRHRVVVEDASARARHAGAGYPIPDDPLELGLVRDSGQHKLRQLGPLATETLHAVTARAVGSVQSLRTLGVVDFGGRIAGFLGRSGCGEQQERQQQ